MITIDIYTLNLSFLLALCAVLFSIQRRRRNNKPPPQAGPQENPPKQNHNSSSTNNNNNHGATKKPRKKAGYNAVPFLTAYALAMTSDWLQGPFLYPLYRDEHGVPPAAVPLLFATGFVASAASGFVVGAWADRRGRRAACLAFCAVYALSCALTAASPWAIGWVLGRVLGGVGTGLLFCAFESWFVGDFSAAAAAAVAAADADADADAAVTAAAVTTAAAAAATGTTSRGRSRRRAGNGDGDHVAEREREEEDEEGEEEVGAEEEMGKVFGIMSSLNSIVAIACGVGSEWLVARAGTRKAPFWAAAAVLGLTAVVIAASWQENYGQTGGDKTKEKKDSTTKSNFRTVLSNPRVLALGAASTVFEGSMYLFVFFWTPALKSVQSSQGDLPYGVIFSSFMAATLASSLAFNIITEKRLMGHVSLLVAILGASAGCFFLSANPRSEQSAFWVFCLFEAAVGMYWPCMGFLKGKLIDDGVRAQVYGMLRIPLNVFVVVSLLFTGDGDAHGRVFSVCAALLLASSGALWIMMARQGPL
ncbi:Molybdate-anion transporter [Madurella fahalii]|uniref:Molybdate-anion transporter n=1 Tax=Madurella fahalii TaxID=1157608 RepID=A0ABQ0GDI6_9PEZI